MNKKELKEELIDALNNEKGCYDNDTYLVVGISHETKQLSWDVFLEGYVSVDVIADDEFDTYNIYPMADFFDQNDELKEGKVDDVLDECEVEDWFTE